LAAEVPDFRPHRLPQWYKGLLDGHEWFSELVTSDLTQLERERRRDSCRGWSGWRPI
jgi:hypothetical protein